MSSQTSRLPRSARSWAPKGSARFLTPILPDRACPHPISAFCHLCAELELLQSHLMVDLYLLPGPEACAPRYQSAGIRVVLADDHALVRRSLRRLLESEGIEVLAEAVDHPSTVKLVIDLRPDVLVLDLSMPNGSGIETIGALRERAPETGIVVVTMHHEPSWARAALARGAVGFVLKELADRELVPAVRAAGRGDRDRNEGVLKPRPARRE